MRAHNLYRPARFLDGIELKLKEKHTPAAHKVIHAIGSRIRQDYMESRYTSRAEAERAFRKLVEQDETCKSCKITAICFGG
jgi:radical SAM protein with 4Fe4S-binding SPASM domain